MVLRLCLWVSHCCSIPSNGPLFRIPERSLLRLCCPQPLKVILEPSIRNYQIAASQSFEQLDKLLTKQARQNPTSAPIYTASTLNLANGPERKPYNHPLRNRRFMSTAG